MSRELVGILDRLGSSQDFWDQRLEKLRKKSRQMDHYFSNQASRMQEIADRCGVHHVDNMVSLAGLE